MRAASTGWKTALVALLWAAAGCSRCGEPRILEEAAARRPAASAGAGGARFGCARPGETVVDCEETQVTFGPGERVTVRLCRVSEGDELGESPTRLELVEDGRSLYCGKLDDVGGLATICAGPEEAACTARIAKDNLAPSARFWAPKSFARSRLLVFFGEVPESDLAAVEIVRVQRGSAQTVLHSEAGRTQRPLVFAKLEDVDKDGVPEVLGWQLPAALEECQPYIPLAIFSLSAAGYARNDALMERWALAHGKAWRGPEPDESVRECPPQTDDDGTPDQELPPDVVPADPQPADSTRE